MIIVVNVNGLYHLWLQNINFMYNFSSFALDQPTAFRWTKRFHNKRFSAFLIVAACISHYLSISIKSFVFFVYALRVWINIEKTTTEVQQILTQTQLIQKFREFVWCISNYKVYIMFIIAKNGCKSKTCL